MLDLNKFVVPHVPYDMHEIAKIQLYNEPEITRINTGFLLHYLALMSDKGNLECFLRAYLRRGENMAKLPNFTDTVWQKDNDYFYRSSVFQLQTIIALINQKFEYNLKSLTEEEQEAEDLEEERFGMKPNTKFDFATETEILAYNPRGFHMICFDSQESMDKFLSEQKKYLQQNN